MNEHSRETVNNLLQVKNVYANLYYSNTYYLLFTNKCIMLKDDIKRSRSLCIYITISFRKLMHTKYK